MKKITSILSRVGTAIGVGLIPFVASAQVNTNIGGQINNANDIVNQFGRIGTVAISIMISLAVIWIIFHVVRYLIMTNDAAKRDEAKKSILWGILGLFIILSIWGLVAILTNTFNTTNQVPTNEFPQIPIR
jgi:Type IV secretion system pilin